MNKMLTLCICTYYWEFIDAAFSKDSYRYIIQYQLQFSMRHEEFGMQFGGGKNTFSIAFRKLVSGK